MAGVAGIALQEKLHDFHLADVGRIVQQVMKEHEAEGCKFRPGTYSLVMSDVLRELRTMLGEKLEAAEMSCPHRGIGVKEAA